MTDKEQRLWCITWHIFCLMRFETEMGVNIQIAVVSRYKPPVQHWCIIRLFTLRNTSAGDDHHVYTAGPDAQLQNPTHTGFSWVMLCCLLIGGWRSYIIAIWMNNNVKAMTRTTISEPPRLLFLITVYVFEWKLNWGFFPNSYQMYYSCTASLPCVLLSSMLMQAELNGAKNMIVMSSKLHYIYTLSWLSK